jgi:hypothetical protein
VLTELESRCTACRGGLVCAEEWEAWHARADEIEAAHLGEHGSLEALESSEAWLAHYDERPTCEEETTCAACAGTGIILTDTGRAVLDWAKQRLHHTAA